MLVSISLAAAFAPGTFDDAGLVLRPAEPSVFAAGVGAPTVEWDGEQFVMFFESPAPAGQAPAGCGGAYQIGRATSPDGLVWTVDETPAFTFGGEPGSTRYCSVAQPAVLFDGSLWNLFWSSSREPAEGTTTNQPTGIGWATSADGLTWTVQAETLIPYRGTPMGLASATAVNGLVYLAWSEYPDLFMISRPSTGGSWSAPMLVVDHLLAGDWASEWALGPSLLCDVGADAALGMMFAGDSTATGERSLAWASSTDGSNWTVDAGSPLTGGTLDYGSLNHWELLRFTDSGTILWYSRTDEESGFKAIGAAFAGTAAGEPEPRLCPNPYLEEDDTGDTGSPGDSGTVDSGDTAASGDSGGKSDPGDCGCNAGAKATAPALLTLGLALLRRRRR